MTFDPPGPPPIVPGPQPDQNYSLGAVMPAPAAKRRVHPLSIVLAVLGAVGLLCGIVGIGVGASKSGGVTAASSPSPVPVTVFVTTQAAAPSTAAAPTSTQPPPPSVPTIREGNWTVGTDFPPGTYRTTADVSAQCYWSITASGTNGRDIIANDIPGGGRPTVTLAVGQDFHTSRCGTWALIG